LQSSISDDDCDFQLFYIKLSVKEAKGIYLNISEWQQFQENLLRMAEYLDENNIKQNLIIINKIIINFTAARVLLLAYRENDQKDFRKISQLRRKLPILRRNKELTPSQ
jgi:hypothetical protein